jgi:uncharacterized metal-binding protein
MDFVNLYNRHDKFILKTAEDSKNRKNNRLQEIIEYAKLAKINRIGIAHCTTFNKEAEKLKEFLSGEGFQVVKVNCKYGRLPFSNLISGYKGISCNPAGQAKYLEEQGTELNIMMGLCLGHDMIFIEKSKAPVTPFIVKDRTLNHDTLKILKNIETMSER